MDPENRRQFSGRRVRRAREIRVDHRAVGALRLVAFDGAEVDLREKRVVDVTQLRGDGAHRSLRRGRNPEHLVRLLRLTFEKRDVARLRDVVRVHVAFAVEHAFDCAAGGRYSSEMHVAAFLEQEQHLPVGRELRTRDAAVESRGEHLRRTAFDRYQRDVVHRVPDVFRIAALRVDDRLAVRTERRRAVRSLIRRHRARLGARLRLDDEDVAVVVGVGIVGAVRAERDQLAVRRPHRRAIVVAIVRDLHIALGGDVEDVDVALDVGEVAFAVAHELQPGDHVRPRLLVGIRFFGVRLLGIGIRHEHRQLRAVGRPRDRGSAGLVIGDGLRLAAAPIEEIDLRLLAVARRGEGEIAAVGAPARAVLRLLAARQPDRIAACRRDHVDVGVGGVLLPIHRRHGVGDPRAVGTDPRIADALELEDVVGCQRAAGLCREHERRRHNGNDRDQQASAHLGFLSLDWSSGGPSGPPWSDAADQLSD